MQSRHNHHGLSYIYTGIKYVFVETKLGYQTHASLRCHNDIIYKNDNTVDKITMKFFCSKPSRCLADKENSKKCGSGPDVDLVY